MKLRKYFFYWCAAMIVFIVLFTLLGPKVKQINLKEINFKSSESAELYFKNIRSFSYDRIEDDKAKFLLYRIKSRQVDASQQGVNFLIVSNWLLDENYIMAEFYPTNFNLTELVCQSNSNVDTIKLIGPDVEAHYAFAANFYEQLTNTADFYFINEQKERVEFVISETQRKSLKKTLGDYFKLVGKLR